MPAKGYFRQIFFLLFFYLSAQIESIYYFPNEYWLKIEIFFKVRRNLNLLPQLSTGLSQVGW